MAYISRFVHDVGKMIQKLVGTRWLWDQYISYRIGTLPRNLMCPQLDVSSEAILARDGDTRLSVQSTMSRRRDSDLSQITLDCVNVDCLKLIIRVPSFPFTSKRVIKQIHMAQDLWIRRESRSDFVGHQSLLF